MQVLYNSDCFGFLLEDFKTYLYPLEDKKKEILIEQGKEGRLKIGALWLQAGDENTKTNHQYTKMRKNNSLVQNISMNNGMSATSFIGIAH